MSLYSVKVSLKLRAGVAQRPIFALSSLTCDKKVKPLMLALRKCGCKNPAAFQM